MKQYYEELWERLPGDGTGGPGAQRRGRFLVSALEPGQEVLDLGCGAGALTAAIARAGARPIGIDVAEAALRRARAAHPGLDFRLAPVDGPLPLADGAVDVVWASEVLEHVADTARALSEVRRVLRPSGRLLITTPYHGRLKSVGIALRGFDRHYDPLADHLRFYTRASLRRLLVDFGFESVEVSAVGGAPLLRRTLLVDARRARWTRG